MMLVTLMRYILLQTEMGVSVLAIADSHFSEGSQPFHAADFGELHIGYPQEGGGGREPSLSGVLQFLEAAVD